MTVWSLPLPQSWCLLYCTLSRRRQLLRDYSHAIKPHLIGGDSQLCDSQWIIECVVLFKFIGVYGYVMCGALNENLCACFDVCVNVCLGACLKVQNSCRSITCNWQKCITHWVCFLSFIVIISLLLVLRTGGQYVLIVSFYPVKSLQQFLTIPLTWRFYHSLYVCDLSPQQHCKRNTVHLKHQLQTLWTFLVQLHYPDSRLIHNCHWTVYIHMIQSNIKSYNWWDDAQQSTC